MICCIPYADFADLDDFMTCSDTNVADLDDLMTCSEPDVADLDNGDDAYLVILLMIMCRLTR